MDRGHRTLGGGHDCELRVGCYVARSVHSFDTRLLRLIYPQQTRLSIQSTSESFMKISRELGAEVEEQRVALERLPVGE